MIKILYLNPSSQLGGAEWVLLDVATHLDRSRFSPLVVLPKDGPLAELLREAGIEVRFIDSIEAILTLGRYSRLRDYLKTLPAVVRAIGGLMQIRRWIDNEGLSIVHVHGIKMHFLSAILSVATKASVIWHLHDFVGRRRFYRLYFWLAAVCPRLIIVNSRAVAADLGKTGKTVVVHNGVDLVKFSPVTSTGGDFVQVGIIGILAPWKGHQVFLEAAQRVCRQLNRVSFWVVGDEIYDTEGHQGYRRRLQAWVRANDLEERIRFIGFHVDVARAIHSLDIVVHASIEPEPFGRVLIEAMACGKPVIAADAGGVPEIIEDGVNGLLTLPGDVDQLSRVILRLLNDDAERLRLGSAARRRVEECFSLLDQVKRIESIYDSLLHQSSHSYGSHGATPEV